MSKIDNFVTEELPCDDKDLPVLEKIVDSEIHINFGLRDDKEKGRVYRKRVFFTEAECDRWIETSREEAAVAISEGSRYNYDDVLCYDYVRLILADIISLDEVPEAHRLTVETYIQQHTA